MRTVHLEAETFSLDDEHFRRFFSLAGGPVNTFRVWFSLNKVETIAVELSAERICCPNELIEEKS